MLRWTVNLKGPSKHLHAAVSVGNKVYCVGGYSTRETYMQNMGEIDVHVFNTISLRWRKLLPVTTETRERPLEVPSRRVCHTAVLIDDMIYIWGGIANIETEETNHEILTIRGSKCNVLYAFDVNTHRWFMPKVSEMIPPAKCGHSACVLGNVMYIFGGFHMKTGRRPVSSSGRTNDIHTLDTTTMVWTLIDTRGTFTPVSDGHSATIIGAKMLVFMGAQGKDEDKSHFNNVRVFDTETNCWLVTPSAQLLPEVRRGQSVFAYNGELYIFGGDNYPQEKTFKDHWKFNPVTFSWKKIEPKGRLPCPYISRMCCCMVGDRVILFGGSGYTADTQLIILDLSPSLKTLCNQAVIQYGLDSGAVGTWT